MNLITIAGIVLLLLPKREEPPAPAPAGPPRPLGAFDAARSAAGLSPDDLMLPLPTLDQVDALVPHAMPPAAPSDCGGCACDDSDPSCAPTGFGA